MDQLWILVLSKVLDIDGVESILNQFGNYIRSIYYFLGEYMNKLFTEASCLNKYSGDVEKAIQYEPDNPVPRYFKSLWIEQYVTTIIALDTDIDKNNICLHIDEALREVDRVLYMDKEWIETIDLEHRLNVLIH